mmetsp:Transcript_3113/g.6525  ORF Transcript_3113/g.6525 Transcript_3113/m.6525 type:complete len:228 (-) Transcript_3113:52-735(-)
MLLQLVQLPLRSLGLLCLRPCLEAGNLGVLDLRLLRVLASSAHSLRSFLNVLLVQQKNSVVNSGNGTVSLVLSIQLRNALPRKEKVLSFFVKRIQRLVCSPQKLVVNLSFTGSDVISTLARPHDVDGRRVLATAAKAGSASTRGITDRRPLQIHFVRICTPALITVVDAKIKSVEWLTELVATLEGDRSLPVVHHKAILFAHLHTFVENERRQASGCIGFLLRCRGG